VAAYRAHAENPALQLPMAELFNIFYAAVKIVDRHCSGATSMVAKNQIQFLISFICVLTL